MIKKTLFPILLSTVWISISEFFRNEFLFKSYWFDHYRSLGLVFPSESINGALWGVWALLFSGIIYYFSRRHSLLETFLVSWFAGFVLMWVVIYNLGVLPSGLLVYALPLSLLEVFVASWIIKKMS